MTPGDNKTYSCGNLPAAWKLDNIGNLVELPPAQGVEILSQYIQAVFNTSSVKCALPSRHWARRARLCSLCDKA